MAPKGSIGAELGVARGDLTVRFAALDHFDSFYAIDRWSDHHDEKEYQHALSQLKGYEKVTVVRDDVKAWLETVEDESLGFIYIDCYAHTGQEGGTILEAAWPKLAPGGLFSGDDYHERWPETIEAVDLFAAQKDRDLFIWDKHLTNGSENRGMSRFPSWYFRK